VRCVLHAGGFTYLGGSFTRLNDLACQGLVRLGPDGLPDRSWLPAVDGEVQALALHQGRLYVGGRFTSVGGQPHQHLACVDATDGKPLEWRADADGPVQALVVTTDGLIAGGSFLTINGIDRVRLARVDLAKGTVDEAFVVAADAEVRALVVVGNRVVVGGFFARIDSHDRHGLVLLDLPAGSVVDFWRPDVEGVVMALTADRDRVVAGGVFTAVRNQPRTNAAIITFKDGTLAETRIDADGPVMAVSRDAAGRCYLGGEFASVNERPTGPVTRLDPVTGIVDGTWRPNAGEGRCTAVTPTDGRVVTSLSTILDAPRPACGTVLPDGAPGTWRPALEASRPRILAAVTDQRFLYLGGDFMGVGGAPHRHLARFHLGHGGLDTTWHGDADGTVQALTISGKDLLVGGDFTSLRGTPVRRLGRLPLDGRPPQEVAAVDGAVAAILPLSQGMMIAGSFRQVAGQESPGFAWLGSDGVPRPGLGLRQGTDPGTGHALALLPTMRVAVGGAFTAINGEEAGNLAILDLASGRITATPRTDGPVYALLPVDDDVLAGGGFTSVHGQPRGRLARLRADGILAEWQVTADLDVRCLARQGNLLWVGGDFSHLAGQTAVRLGCVDLNSGALRPVTGADDRVSVLVPLPQP
jgi:hypothetical protein